MTLKQKKNMIRKSFNKQRESLVSSSKTG